MLDPFNDTRRYLVWSFILIIFLLVTGIAVADTKDKVIDVLDKIEKIENDDSVYFDKIVSVEPKKVDGQYCYVKIIIRQKGDTIEKEEILECADGRKKFDGPGYWDLFAAFYYKDLKTPEYCRKYSRPNHAFKSYGTVCLDKNGEWEVK
jgi:hypothetical protein|tara:strand:- start:27 stop:473 length:447 start_codon:yes stop_codon:yes gene_type:complete